MTTRCSLALLILLSAATARASFPPPGAALHLNPAQMGMGGLTTTITAGAHTALFNPALLAKSTRTVTINPLLGMDDDFVQLVRFVDDNQVAMNHWQEISHDERASFMRQAEQHDNQWYGFALEPFVGISFPRFALAAYQTTRGQLKLDTGVLLPRLRLRGFSDLVVIGGAGWPLLRIGESKLNIGVAARYYERRHLPVQTVTAEEAAGPVRAYESLLDELGEKVRGYGLDLGTSYSLFMGEPGSMHAVELALVVRDLYGSLHETWIKPEVNIGAMYHMPFARNLILKRWDVGIDLVDQLNRSGTSYFSRINLGSEISLFANFFSLRGGLHQGYPTYGLGLNFRMLKLHVARYARELGDAPGLEGEDLFYLQASLGF